MSFGTNSFLTGLATAIGLPIWGITHGEWILILVGPLFGAALMSFGYALMRAEEPPKPPSSSDGDT